MTDLCSNLVRSTWGGAIQVKHGDKDNLLQLRHEIMPFIDIKVKFPNDDIYKGD